MGWWEICVSPECIEIQLSQEQLVVDFAYYIGC